MAKETSIVNTMAGVLGMAQQEMMDSLSATVFRTKPDEPKATKGELGALLVVCKEHGLNPFKKEIYAFRTKSGGLAPIVPIDGWTHIINSHPKFDGLTTEEVTHPEFGLGVTTTIHRKDRKVPTVSTEWMNECKGNSTPWQKWPMRMLRWKSIIQCARVAFSLSGIMDEDEGERLRQADAEIVDNDAKQQAVRGALPSAFEVTAGGGKADTWTPPPAKPAPIEQPSGSHTFTVSDNLVNPEPLEATEAPSEAEAPDTGEAITDRTKSRIMGHCAGLSINKDKLIELVNGPMEMDVETLDHLTEDQGQDVVEFLVEMKAEAKAERDAIQGES